MNISLFNGTREDQMALVDEVRDIPWELLGRTATQQAWAPGTFKNSHRKIANFETMSLFVADVDGGLSIAEARELFKDYRCIIGTSKSHQREKVKKSGATEPACDRFRIILELAEPITSDRDFKATWFWVQEHLCRQMDPACKDSSRFYFPCTEIVGEWSGKQLPVTRATTLPVSRIAEGTTSVTVGARKLTPSKRTLTFLALGLQDGQVWHHELVAACMDLKQQLWPEDQARAALEQVTGHLDEHDSDTIEDIWANREPRHAAREENNDAVRKLIQKCTLFENLRRADEYVFVDTSEGKTHVIDIARARTILGRDDWRTYRSSNKRDANFEFNPYEKPISPGPDGVSLFNTYRPARWRHREFWFNEPVPKLETCPEPFNEFFAHLTDNNVASKEYLLDWMAHSLRARNFTILTAIGSQGVGKGILAEILKHLHGEHNYCQPKDDVFKERFNSPLKDKTLVNVDEISLKTKEDHDRLKAVVNDSIAIEEKGKNAENCRNYANFYISSNHLDAIQIEPGDRRYSIIQLASKKIIETPLRAHIHTLTSPDEIARLGSYLLYRPVTHDMLQPFRSERFEEVRQAGLTDWELYMVEDFCQTYSGKTFPVAFVLDAIKEAAELRSLGRRRLTDLAKKYPEKFRVVCDPKQPAKRIVQIA